MGGRRRWSRRVSRRRAAWRVCVTNLLTRHPRPSPAAAVCLARPCVERTRPCSGIGARPTAAPRMSGCRKSRALSELAEGVTFIKTLFEGARPANSSWSERASAVDQARHRRSFSRRLASAAAAGRRPDRRRACSPIMALAADNIRDFANARRRRRQSRRPRGRRHRDLADRGRLTATRIAMPRATRSAPCSRSSPAT